MSPLAPTASRDEVLEGLLRLLDEQLADPAAGSIDWDRLFDAGAGIGRAGHVAIDDEVASWVEQRGRTLAHHEVGASFLIGYWFQCRAVSAAAVALLAASLESLPRRADSFAYGATLIALSSLADRPGETLAAGIDHEALRAIVAREVDRLRATGELPNLLAHFTAAR